MNKVGFIISVFITLHGQPAFGADANNVPANKLLEALVGGSPSEQMAAVISLSKAGKEAVPGLIDVVEKENDDAQGRAGMALQKIFEEPANQTPEAMTRLVGLTKSNKYTTAATAIDSLNKFQSQEASAAIADAAKSHAVGAVRVCAIRALSTNVNYQRHSIDLKSMLKDPSEHIRSEAAGALGYHGDKAGLDAVLMALEHSKDGSRERRSALRAAGLIGDSRALPVLKKIRDKEAPEGEMSRTVETIEYKQLKTDNARVGFLRKSMRKREGNIDRWALFEVRDRAKKVPLYRDILDEAARDSKHPQNRMAKELLKDK